MVLKALLKPTKTAFCTFEPPASDFAIVCARRPTASKVLLAFLCANWLWSLDFSIKSCIWLRMNRSHILSSAGVVAIGRNLFGTWADCCFLGSGEIWISLQDEGRMPWEREVLMVSVTKKQSSFAHFFKTKGGIPRELSVEFDLMRGKSGRISELEVGLNPEGLKRGEREVQGCQ